MGHNFGFAHDTGTCKCLTPRGCIMGGHKTRLPGFSNCSLTSLQRVNDACLYNVPTYKAVNGYCGNGIREEGEECDCGTPEFKKQGKLCRAVQSDCDVPEYCTGDSRDVIQGNTNFYSIKTRDLNPKVTARYLRINPQYWKGWPCLRTDFMGCSKDEASPTEPTPLRSYYLNLCLTTRSKNCTPDDNDLLEYASGDLCLESHFQFTLGADGVLRHTCSGKMVCPENGGTRNGVRIVVSSTCTLEDSKFERTSDCVEPLGMQNGEIKDSQITASSAGKNEPAYNARLNLEGKSWCAAEKSKSEYLQVDLGEIKTVSKVLIQGKGTWRHWVTGFFLHYSDDGQRWASYSESGDKQHSNSHCYLGKCSEILETQCKDLWGAMTSYVANYSVRTAKPNQLLTMEGHIPKYVWMMGINAVLKLDDEIGQGMVREGTKCGINKMCIDYKCQSFDDLGISVRCPSVNNEECAGRGICTNKKECHCKGGFDHRDSCNSELIPRDGAWGDWSSWTECDKGCDGGKRRRHRFCNNPFPLHGGADCPGERHEKEGCNTESCPVVISCHHLQKVGKEQNHDYPDGVCKIYPTGPQPIMAYCDMSRDGGGWTLLVTSHTNGWTAENVRLKNSNSPKLTNDYSILQYADSIKDNINVAGSKFEYRLEAQSPDRWGGVWKAPRGYTFTAEDNKQTRVELLKKFDNWKYANSGIEQRMPWISGARLTTSEDAFYKWEGTITGTSHETDSYSDDKGYHPAPWIKGHLMEHQPSYIWYWMREGPYKVPTSCKEVYFRGLLSKSVSDGLFSIKPPGQHEVKTLCDFTSEGGPWTLLVTSKNHRGWDEDNIKERNSDKPSLQDDYSILGLADAIKDSDKAQELFQYRMEADDKRSWGGIWEAPRDYTFLATSDEQTNVRIVKKFDSWDEKSNLGKRMPRLGLSGDLLLTSASTVDEPSGSLVYNSSASSASYLQQEKPNPRVVRYWMREGARLSCNDHKIHGVRAGIKYEEDSFQLIKVSDTQYLPVYCDMITAKGAFTLIVTSAHNNWTREQVPHRNELHPGLNRDYSILDLADGIKDLSSNGTFQYMLDANTRRHWAPTSYRLGVKVIRKFNDWEFYWRNAIDQRMPWFDAKGTYKKALLTTSSSPTYYPAGTSCNAIDQIFILDEDGVIHHKCSKKVICPEGNNPTYGRKLMLKDKCDLDISKHERVSPNNAMKNLKNNFCIHPKSGWPKEGVYLVYYKGCGGDRLRFNFFDLG
ncbi:hypothetical protein pdam_00009262 [Pocillopora damicornis]|uniref:F5/8 type C domain-containing protein n=1 Tax=Pocillopora damicornis TaxID=46731 RepID=A0A3M6TU36_POCDA|nr:hypothetical protein pdam_00009262 [Pocillopora damicornis]